jgi:hypothetical protein
MATEPWASPSSLSCLVYRESRADALLLLGPLYCGKEMSVLLRDFRPNASTGLALHSQAEHLHLDEGRLQTVTQLLEIAGLAQILIQLVHGVLARIAQ